MFEERLAQLEERLAATQAEVQSLRLQLDAAKLARPRSVVLGQMLGCLTLVALLTLAGFYTVATTTAQAPVKTTSHKAPFVVVDAAGKAILRVADEGVSMRSPLVVVDNGSKPIMDVGVKGRRLHLYGNSGAEMVGLGETKEGNSASVILGQGNNLVGIQSETGDKKGGFYYVQGGKVTARLGEEGLIFYAAEGKKGSHVWIKGMAIYDKGEKPIARLGADPASQFGSLVLGKDGKGLIALVVEKDIGTVIVRDSANQNLVELGELGVQVFHKNQAVGRLGLSPSGKGSGYLSLGNPGGNTIVEAGMLPDGDGVVRAYPLSGRTPFPIPNFIRGGKSDK